jgi:hypothetical protein
MPSRERVEVFDTSTLELLVAVENVLTTKWRLRSCERSEHGIKAKTSFSLISFGEDIEVEIQNNSHGAAVVTITSNSSTTRLAQSPSLVDWGLHAPMGAAVGGGDDA